MSEVKKAPTRDSKCGESVLGRGRFGAMLPVALVIWMIAIGTGSVEAQIRKPLRKHDRLDPEKNFVRALRLYKDQQYDAAQEVLKETIDSHTDHFPSLLLAGLVAVKRDDIDLAARLNQRALTLHPDNRLVNLLASQIAFRREKFVKAFEFLQRASKSTSDLDGLPVSQQELDGMQMRIKDALHSAKRTSVDFYTPSKEVTQGGMGVNVPDDKKLSVAVFRFDARAGTADSALGMSVGDMMVTSLVQSNCYRVVERSQLDKVVAEQDLQMSDLIDQATAIKVGELMGIQVVLVGSVSGAGERVEIDCRLVDVTTAQIRSAAGASAERRDGLRNAIGDLVTRLTQQTYK